MLAGFVPSANRSVPPSPATVSDGVAAPRVLGVDAVGDGDGGSSGGDVVHAGSTTTAASSAATAPRTDVTRPPTTS